MPRDLRPRKKPNLSEEGAAEPKVLLRRDELDKVRGLLTAIDTFFDELGIVQEFYNVGKNAMIYLRFEPDDSYFYFTSFMIDEDKFEPPELPNTVIATPRRFKARLMRILQTNNTHLYIKSTMCILNGLNFAYLVQAKIILTSLLHDIYISKKDDGTNAAEENSLRNFNFLLGFWYTDMTAGIQFPSDDEYDQKVEERIDALKHEKPAKAAEASAAAMSSSGSDYSHSDTEESEEESFVEDPGPGATVATTGFDKSVFNINTLELVEKMLESVILPKSHSRWEQISKTNYLQHIQDKKTIGKDLPWSFKNPSELSGMALPVRSLNECFTYLQELEHTSGGKRKKKYTRRNR
jgi:hypothetical protein